MDFARQTVIIFSHLASTAGMRMAIYSLNHCLTSIVFFLTDLIHSILLHIFFYILVLSFSTSSIYQVVADQFLYYKKRSVKSQIQASTSTLGRVSNVNF